jgi:hypothetical protein
MFTHGLGVTADDGEALKFYQLSANQNYAPAQFCLGLMRANGQGVIVAKIEAAKWFGLAAAQGFTPAQEALDDLHEKSNN